MFFLKNTKYKANGIAKIDNTIFKLISSKKYNTPSISKLVKANHIPKVDSILCDLKGIYNRSTTENVKMIFTIY